MSVPYVDPIPDGWEMRLDDTTQTYYFIDHKNKVTQWQHPINKLVYRPAHLQPRGALNGNQPTPISINRQAVPSSNAKGLRDQSQPASNPASHGGSVPPTGQRSTSEQTVEPSRNSGVPEQKDCDIGLVDKVLEKAKPVIDEVNAFEGSVNDKNYLRLMETLEVLILELDGIGVDGLDSVRAARRAAVRELQQAIEMLEFRSSANADEVNPSDNVSIDKTSLPSFSPSLEGNT